MRFQRRWLSATAVAVALCASVVPSAAQSAGGGKPALTGTEGARQLYAAGEAKYKAADYAGALNDFQAADAIKPASQAARYIGLCQDKLGHYPEAITAYDRFLADVPPKLQGEVDSIKKRVDEIKAMPGHVRVETSPAGANLTIDGKPQAGLSPIDVDLPPGPHTVHAAADGREPADQNFTVAFASKMDVSVQLHEAAPPLAVVPVPVVTPAPPPPPPPPPQEPRSKLPAFITGGLAIVAAGVGTAFGIVTINDKSNFNKTPTESIAETGQNHALIADMSFGIAITLGVTSAVLFLTRDESDAAKPKAASLTTVKLSKHTGQKGEEGPSVTATPFMTPHGGGAGALLSF
jgi:tetratricopeptide (TPR) repeat protein